MCCYLQTHGQNVLSNKIVNTSMHTTYKKWLTNFIADRFAENTRGNITFTSRTFKNGTPKGEPSYSATTYHNTQILTFMLMTSL